MATLHGLASTVVQPQNTSENAGLGVQGQAILNRVHQKAWWFYWSSPEMTSSKGVPQLVCLALSSGDQADKRLVKKADVYGLAAKAGLSHGEADLLQKKVRWTHHTLQPSLTPQFPRCRPANLVLLLNLTL